MQLDERNQWAPTDAVVNQQGSRNQKYVNVPTYDESLANHRRIRNRLLDFGLLQGISSTLPRLVQLYHYFLNIRVSFQFGFVRFQMSIEMEMSRRENGFVCALIYEWTLYFFPPLIFKCLFSTAFRDLRFRQLKRRCTQRTDVVSRRLT